MLSASDVHKALYALQALNLNFQIQGQADFWTPVLNEAAPDMTANELRHAINRLAASRDTHVRQGRITPADVLDALEAVRHGEKQERINRLTAAKHEFGDFTAHPTVTDPDEFLRFKQVTQAAFLDGSTVDQAVAAGFAALGRPVPAPQLPADPNRKLNLPNFRNPNIEMEKTA